MSCTTPVCSTASAEGEGASASLCRAGISWGQAREVLDCCFSSTLTLTGDYWALLGISASGTALLGVEAVSQQRVNRDQHHSCSKPCSLQLGAALQQAQGSSSQAVLTFPAAPVQGGRAASAPGGDTSPKHLTGHSYVINFSVNRSLTGFRLFPFRLCKLSS